VSLTPGGRLGPYEVTALIGEGGMGQVYRATDTNLDRQVAVKVLPDAFAADPERVVRFEREARTLAALNHPNIAQIFGLERADGVRALVMELVEGPTLADRIARGTIQIDEALAIAKQIAEALEAAHEQGIIHRDLKPANVKLRPDGAVKVLDFGLAKLVETSAVGAAEGSEAATHSPTLSLAATRAGVILGTAAYMSPEQARGATVDRRSDLWAFGVVLYEMLTCTRLFDGATISDTLAAVLKTEPDWTRLPADTPRPIRTLLRRCLEKDRRRRLDSAAAARLDIDEALTATSTEIAAGDPPTANARRSLSRSVRLPWMVATVAVFGLVALGVPATRHLRETVADAPRETRTEIVTPATTEPLSFALSPDGRSIVFVASGDNASRLWLRRLDATDAQPLAGTEGATLPFWSPDSVSVGFFADGQLKRLDLDGRPPRSLAPAPRGLGGAWGDGVIVFAASSLAPLSQVPAAGGQVTAATTLDTSRDVAHWLPQFLPDGRRFIFFVGTFSESDQGFYLGSLESRDTHLILQADPGCAALASTGWIWFQRQTSLLASRLDLTRGEATGEPVPVAELGQRGAPGTLQRSNACSASRDGLVAFRADIEKSHHLVWFDRDGTEKGGIGTRNVNGLVNPELSPDDRQVAGDTVGDANRDVWVEDSVRRTRLTFDAAAEWMPIWSPDGRWIIFRSERAGAGAMYEKRSTGGAETPVIDRQVQALPDDWSRDGRFLLYEVLTLPTVRDLWVMPLGGDGKPFPFLATPAEERYGQFSPDGRWVAYESNESGRFEIYLRPFPTGDGQWQVSSGGGMQVRWSADGTELFYLSTTLQLMAVPVSAAGGTLALGAPTALFAPRIWAGLSGFHPQYDVSRDGRFLINVEVDKGVAGPITIIQNWRLPGAN
jgi:Tol biopolymer transport system component